MRYLFESEKIKLVTSNNNKLREYRNFGLKNIGIEKGKDLPEVDGSDIEVIIYKAKEAGKNRIVDDTSLTVEGAEIGVNIRWLLDNLYHLKGKKARWCVLLGLNTGNHIKVYKGELLGKIGTPIGISKDSFGFDPFFIPSKNNINNKSVEQLEKEGKKDSYSARKFAVDNLRKDNYIKKIIISEIPEWTGKYQH